MAFGRLVVPFLVLSVVNAVHNTVYLWGDIPRSSLKGNPLSSVSELDFDNLLIEERQADPVTLVFIEETLSVEDFSRKSPEGSSFPYLQSNLGDAVYLPSVNNAVDALKQLAGNENVQHLVYTENGLSGDINTEKGTFVFINLKDAREGESRADLLRRHDDIMREITTNLQKTNKVIAVYTSNYPSWTNTEGHLRYRRQANSNESIADTDNMLDGLRIDMDSIRITSDNETIMLTAISSSSSEFFKNTTTTMNTTLMFNNDKLVLNFREIGGYWYFETVTLTMANKPTKELYPVEEVFAMTGFSYRCAQDVVFNSRNETIKYTLVFEDLKVQPFFETTNNTLKEFGDSYNCVGFFSAPIWAALFVVFILLSITFYGIMMMMDIRSMDRFDDPKGKTITINASD